MRGGGGSTARGGYGVNDDAFEIRLRNSIRRIREEDHVIQVIPVTCVNQCDDSCHLFIVIADAGSTGE